MDFMTSALIASWAAIGLLALVVSGLIRQVHQLTRRPGPPPRAEGPGPGDRAPGADDPAFDGAGPDAARVLLFLSDSCRICDRVLAAAVAWAEAGRGPDAPRLLALYADAAPPAAAAQSAVAVGEHRAALFAAHDVIATPFAVVAGADRRVLRAEPLGSTAALAALLAAHTPGGQAPPGTDVPPGGAAAEPSGPARSSR